MQPLQVVPAPTPPEPKPTAKRMSLRNVVSGKQQTPPRVVIYGPDGIGKSTFAAGAPIPIFLGTEDGTSELDVTRFPEPKTFSDAMQAIEVLTHDAHDYKTLVIDSLDWLEPLAWQELCFENRVTSIEDVGGGYGRGYTAAVAKWRLFLAAIDGMRKTKGMNVVMVAHAMVKTFQNPEGDDFDHYILKMHEKSAGLIREWSDAVFFAQYETHTATNEKTKRIKGVTTGRRLINTEKSAAFHAKNRYGLPAELPLSWASFEQAMKERDPEPVRERCAALLALVTDDDKRKAGEAYLEKNRSNLHKLNEFENRLKKVTT